MHGKAASRAVSGTLAGAHPAGSERKTLFTQVDIMATLAEAPACHCRGGPLPTERAN